MNTDNQYIQRRLMTMLMEHLDHPEVTMLVGPRQSGKTTILKQLDAQLRAGGRNTLWFNLDFEDDFRHLASQGALLQKIRLELGSGGVVFIDEIQRKENAGLFLKGLYDQGLPWKFVVSGSGSIELKDKISESLAGRKRLFELATVNFGEFADFRTGYRYANRLREFSVPSRLKQSSSSGNTSCTAAIHELSWRKHTRKSWPPSTRFSAAIWKRTSSTSSE